MAGKKMVDNKEAQRQAAKQSREEFFAGEKVKMQAKMDEILVEFADAARFKAGARRLRLLTLELTKMMKVFRDDSMRVDEGPEGKRIPAEKKK